MTYLNKVLKFFSSEVKSRYKRTDEGLILVVSKGSASKNILVKNCITQQQEDNLIASAASEL